MAIALSCLAALLVIGFLVFVRPSDLPEPEPVSPFQHLDDRKAAIYENLRDLQFEYRVGKLSDDDYQQTKRDLQSELAAVLAGIDQIKAALPAPEWKTGKSEKKTARLAPEKPYQCPSCGAGFDTPLKFCGECGKSMQVRA